MIIIPGLISMICWGVAIYLAATVSRKIGNLLTLFWMQLFGLLIGTIYFLGSLRTFNLKLVTNFLPILFIIAVLQIIAYLSFYRGMEKGQVSIVSPLGASWALITAILGVFVYHEVLKKSQFFAVLLIVLGILMISVNLDLILKSKKVELLRGVKEGIIAMLGWGIALFLLVFPTRTLNWFLPSFIFRVFVIIMLGIYLILLRKPFTPKLQRFPLLTLIIIGAFDMLAFMSLSLGVIKTNSSIIAPIASANTLVTITLASILLKEKLKINQISGIISIVAGLILVSF